MFHVNLRVEVTTYQNLKYNYAYNSTDCKSIKNILLTVDKQGPISHIYPISVMLFKINNYN